MTSTPPSISESETAGRTTPAAGTGAPAGGVKRASAKGEANVWLTGMGLSIGMTMVLGLLLLVLVRGVSVHWPARVAQLRLNEGAESPLGGKTVFAGEVVLRQQRSTGSGEELQLHVGNKDLFGQNYVWVQARDIAESTQPANLLMLERMEYGDAIGLPIELRFKNTGRLDAADPGFTSRLESLVAEASSRREQIEKIEKNEIGEINRRMLKLEIRTRAGETLGETGERAALQAEYDTLAARAAELRAAQEENQLVYRTVCGEEKVLPTGSIVHFYHPNRLGFAGRFGVFCHRFWKFLSADPREANTEGGIWPAIFGTFVMTVLMSLFVTPLGVIAAIYLREYARQGTLVRSVRISVNNLAGVPSIVFGVFGLGFFVYLFGQQIDESFFRAELEAGHKTYGTGGILWASLTLALLTLPVVIVATEEALSAVPRGVREAALACGASKWQTIQRVVLPSAAPGVLTGVILAMARGAGEVAPLMLVGVVKLAPSLPIDSVPPFIHPDRKFMHLGFHIYDLGFQSPDSEAAKPMVFATTLLLIALVVVLNLAAILLRNHLRKKYAASTF
jgi:phosphate transport system permease protein